MEQYSNVFSIPKNFTTSTMVMNLFELRGVIEGVLFSSPFAALIMLLPIDGFTKIFPLILVCLPIAAVSAIGVDDDYVSAYLKNRVEFSEKKRIVRYNPRPKLEAVPDYLQTEEADGELPKDRLLRFLGSLTGKEVIMDEEYSAAFEEDPSIEYFFEDDIGIVEKPDEIKTKGELKREAAERKKKWREVVKEQRRLIKMGVPEEEISEYIRSTLNIDPEDISMKDNPLVFLALNGQVDENEYPSALQTLRFKLATLISRLKPDWKGNEHSDAAEEYIPDIGQLNLNDPCGFDDVEITPTYETVGEAIITKLEYEMVVEDTPQKGFTSTSDMMKKMRMDEAKKTAITVDVLTSDVVRFNINSNHVYLAPRRVGQKECI